MASNATTSWRLPANGTADGGGGSSSADGEASRKRSRDGGGGTGPFAKVLRMAKPKEEGQAPVFEVQMSDGSKALVTSARLKREAPVLLVEYYESRLVFPA